MSKLKVRTCLLIEAILSALLPLYLFLSVRVEKGETEMSVSVIMNPFVFFAFVFAAVAVVAFLRIRREHVDEYAREALRMADAWTLRASLVLHCALLFGLFLVPYYILGYAFSGGVFLLFLLRFALYAMIDGKGLVG